MTRQDEGFLKQILVRKTMLNYLAQHTNRANILILTIFRMSLNQMSKLMIVFMLDHNLIVLWPFF